MQFSLGRNRGPASSGAPTNSASSSQSNSRSAAMQKAIERNRAKMASRQSSAGGPPPTPRNRPAPQVQSRMQAPSQASSQSEAPKSAGSSVLAKLREQRMAKEAVNKPAMSASAGRRPTPGPSASAATRRPVTDSDSIEMSSPIRKKTTAPAAPSYTEQTEAKALTKPKAKVSAKRKVKSKSKKKGEVTSWGVKLCWGFCLFLLGRLVFSQGGVIEFFDKKSTLEQAYHESKLLTEENTNLMKEIELIRTNHKYKKKLVRDHLGYIARDEYLILFPENSETSVRGLSSI